VEGQSRHPAKRERNWTLIVFAVVGIYALLLVVLNDEKTHINFVFFSASIRKLVLIILCLVIGFVAGLVFDRWRVTRKA
jgi:uncharacterized integral membrane protein